LQVRSATVPCVSHGWNVRPETILDIKLLPKDRLKVEPSYFDNEKFTRVVDDTFRSYFTNVKTGLQYYVDVNDMLISVHFYPSRDSNTYRCEGFPPFDPTTLSYSLGDSPFKINSFADWNVNLIGSFGVRVKDSKNLKGIIFLYFDRRSYDQADELRKKLTEYFSVDLGVPRDRLKVCLGGFRDDNTIETYTLPTEYPDPTPLPKYATPMLFRGS
jgi:hypothetical protein